MRFLVRLFERDEDGVQPIRRDTDSGVAHAEPNGTPIGIRGGEGSVMRTRQRESDELTPREIEVLTLIARGLTNRQAAERMSLGIKTIETYRSRLSEKLQIKGRAALVQAAIDRGLLG